MKNTYIIYLYFYLSTVLHLMYLNFSMTMMCQTKFIYMNLYMTYMNLWFVFLMGIFFYFMMYLLTKKMISNMKLLLNMYMYTFMYVDVVMLIVMNDFMNFMMLFESLMFPITFISLLFSFSNSFIFAIYYLMIFSSISSVLCIIMVMTIVFHFNMMNLQLFMDMSFFDSFYLSMFIWALIWMAFGMKYPMWPLHIWLPEVHVEVPTEMSALLACVVLKMGFFGIFKFMYLIFNNMSMWFMGLMDAMIILGMTFLSNNMLFLSDYKKMMAHWSIIHTGMGLILLWYNDLLFIGLIFFCNLGHIMSSAFMFTMMGFMYDNYGISIFLIMVSFFGIGMMNSIFLMLFLFNMDFPFMLLFYVDMFMLYGLMSVSYIYLYAFSVIMLIMFTSSIYIYICITYYSFVWLDKFISTDVTMNDVIFFFSVSIITLLFYFLMYLVM